MSPAFSTCNTCKVAKELSEFPDQTGPRRRYYKRMCNACRRATFGPDVPLPSTNDRQAYDRARALARKYGLSIDDYDALVEKQNGLCAICGQPPTPTSRGASLLVVDHDHETGRVRGLLCNLCNPALSRIEVPGWAQQATDYLSRAASPDAVSSSGLAPTSQHVA